MTWPAVVGGEAWMRRIERRVGLIERRAGGGGGGGGGGSAATPIGAIIEWPSSTVPTGFLLCDGSAVSRTTYAALFARIGTTYGVGDNSTTFNLPNKKGRVGVGVDSAQTEFTPIGKTGGAKTVTLDTTQIPSHVHTVLTRDDATGPLASMQGLIRGDGGAMFSNVGKSYRFTGPVEATGGGLPHTNLQPYISLNYIINASADGGGGGGSTTLAVQDTTTLDLTLTGSPSAGYLLKGDVLGGAGGKIVPAGVVLPWSGTGAVPSGFLLADGSAVSRTIYSDLFAAIGTQYGVGDNTTTFNLPNYKGRVAVGHDTTQAEFDVLGETGGLKQTNHGFVMTPVASNMFQDPGATYNAAALAYMNTWLTAGGSSAAVRNAVVQNAGGALGSDGANATEVGHGRYTSTNLQPYITQKFIISIGSGGTSSGSRGVVGEIITWPGASAPEDFLLCQGQFVDKITYAALYAVVGDAYIGSATPIAGQFRLPEMRARVAMGADGTYLRGAYGGEAAHTLTLPETPPHSHNVGHLAGGLDGFVFGGGPDTSTFAINVDAVNASGTFRMNTDSKGGGLPHNILQPYTVTNFAIRYRTTLGTNDTRVAVADTVSLDLTLSGDGSPVTPYSIKGDVLVPTREFTWATVAGIGSTGVIIATQTITNPYPGQSIVIDLNVASMITNTTAGAVPSLIAIVYDAPTAGTAVARLEDQRVHSQVFPETHQGRIRRVLSAVQSAATFRVEVTLVNRSAAGTLTASGGGVDDFGSISIQRAAVL